MCNLYFITTNQTAIACLFRCMNRCVGNLAPVPGVFPDYPAPVIAIGAVVARSKEADRSRHRRSGRARMVLKGTDRGG
jgi:hypothetical protein